MIHLKTNPFEYFKKPIPQVFWQILIISPAIFLVASLLDLNYLHFIVAVILLRAHQVHLPKLINKTNFYKNKFGQILKRLNPTNLWNFLDLGRWERRRQEKAKHEETVRAYEKARREKMDRQEERERERANWERKKQEEWKKEEIREEAARRQREWDRQNQKRNKQESTKKQKTVNWWEGKNEISLKREWKRLAKIYHPDNGSSPDSEMMKRINAQYDEARINL